MNSFPVRRVAVAVLVLTLFLSLWLEDQFVRLRDNNQLFAPFAAGQTSESRGLGIRSLLG